MSLTGTVTVTEDVYSTVSEGVYAAVYSDPNSKKFSDLLSKWSVVDNVYKTAFAIPWSQTSVEQTVYAVVYKSDKDTVISSVYDTIVPASGGTINPTTATFDKNTSSADYKDIVVTMTLNGNTLSAIKNGATVLNAVYDYTVSGSTVTIKKEYLAARANGDVVLTFDFSAGADPTLTVTVSDSTQPPEAKPFTITGSLDRTSGIKATATVNRTNAQDHSGTEVVIFQLMKNGNEPVSIVALEKNIQAAETLIAHFSVSGPEYTIKVFVFDQFTSDTGSASTNLTVPKVLQ